MGDEISVCERCKRELDPDADATVHAVEVSHVRTFEGDQVVEGSPVFFHERCWQPSAKYRRT